ncbi:uncharacterized protein LOC106665776 isoform X2 [Cimex lectularius]|uniref:NADH:ubiquinone oxidoreductase intermediate-associated protein 30 domain-containing protein n=1 Tax=Cimex lectularius TaxID=79782 RepID=A0A8I6RN22_CIMLE|nr:uncharacterized protein LOC106665776 isoform X2 [Cimex lectularius]
MSEENCIAERQEKKVLFDFTTIPSLSGWSELSDTVREVGKSKAAFQIQKTLQFQRAIFFTLLNPQPNGAGFAGFRTDVQLDLSNFTALAVKHRAQGQNFFYKVCLRHRGLNREPHVSYEQIFEANKEFGYTFLPFSNFLPFYRGKKQDPTKVGFLDTANITNFEFQIFGGVYLPLKQSGASSLEIDTVEAV